MSPLPGEVPLTHSLCFLDVVRRWKAVNTAVEEHDVRQQQQRQQRLQFSSDLRSLGAWVQQADADLPAYQTPPAQLHLLEAAIRKHNVRRSGWWRQFIAPSYLFSSLIAMYSKNLSNSTLGGPFREVVGLGELEYLHGRYFGTEIKRSI